MIYFNTMEQVVEDIYDRHKVELECCDCPQCRCDIITSTLNNIQPHYVATKQGELMIKLANLKTQNSSDILTALIKSAIKVNNSPRH